MLIYLPTYIESRLVDCAKVCNLLGDRELTWLRYADTSNMPDVLKETSSGDWKESALDEAGLGKPIPETRADLSRRRIDEAYACIDWMKYADYELRDVLCFAIRHKMEGAKQVNWSACKRELKAWKVRPDALRMRYKRGLNQIADALNNGENEIKNNQYKKK